MFDSIATSYDRVNDILSLGIHRRWRIQAIRHAKIMPGMNVLDCACGTGDLAIEAAKVVGPRGKVIATDFSANMLSQAPEKARILGLDIDFSVGDAMKIEFPTNHFDAVTIGFGIRNVEDPMIALSEMGRVVKPGGIVMVLEFGQPRGAVGVFYRLYSEKVLPFLGGLLSGNRSAYSYLHESSATFASGHDFCRLMLSTGRYSRVIDHPLSMGICHAYVGTVNGNR